MATTLEGLQKAREDALAEINAMRLEVEATKAELAAEKEKLGTVVPVATALPVRSRAPINYPQLTRSNYTLWAMQMRVAMQSAGVWAATSSEDVDHEMDRDALLAIYQGVSEDVLASLAGKDTAKQAWEAIKVVNVGHDRVRETNLQTLRKAFEALEMEDTEAVDAFATRLNRMVSSIRALGDEVKELTVVQKILQAAPARFMHLVTSLEQCVDLKTLTVEDLFGRFKAHEERVRMRFGSPVDGQHLMLSIKQWEAWSSRKSSGGAETSSSGGKSDGGSSRGANRGKAAEKPPQAAKGEKKKKKFKCYNCGERGHFSNACPNPKKKKETALVAEVHDEDPALLLASTFVVVQGNEEEERVFLQEVNVKPKLEIMQEKNQISGTLIQVQVII